MTDLKPPESYVNDIKHRLDLYKDDQTLSAVSEQLLDQMNRKQYAYNFTWFGRPVIQIPQDTITFQEIIWEVQPDLIIETGIAHGGSLIFSSSMLALLESFGMVESPLVVGIDIDIREHNRRAIEQHPASRWIRMFEGSSIDANIVGLVEKIAQGKKRVLVCLDSNHTHDHVLAELRAYAPLVTPGSFCIVLDTGIEDIDPSAVAPGREWCKGNSPKSALNQFIRENHDFVIDTFFHEKAWVTSAPGGFLRRVR